MKRKSNSITANLKYIVLAIVFLAMIAQLSPKKIVFITGFNSEITSRNSEQDIVTEEVQESNNENDKIEIQQAPSLKDIYHYNITDTYNFCIVGIIFSEIPILPPEFV